MKEFNWQIEHNCPQCGAPVTLEETDRLFVCPYCRTRLYLIVGDYFRYCIPPPETTSGEIIYIPYWRLKGLSLSVQEMGVNSRFVDVSVLALASDVFPPSLGLKPQALKLNFVSPKIEGSFIAPQLPFQELMTRAQTSAAPVFHQTFIGEAIGRIYSPMYVENDKLCDAFLKRPVATWEKENTDLYSFLSPEGDGQIRFIPTLCPRCGWDMEGGKASLALACRNCNSVWSCSGGVFAPVPYTVILPDAKGPLSYLPFWRLKVAVEGIELASYADLIRVGNLPRIITDVSREKTLYFWSPAFKVNPAVFLRWARQMTLLQPEGRETETLPGGLYPVTLPVREALETVKITIAGIATDKTDFYPLLSHIRVKLEEPLLVYHPFTAGRQEFIHTHLSLSIDKNALAYGVQL